MQRVVKLHPAAVMLALLAGGTIGGFFGLLLAVPAAAVLKILVGHLWRTYVLGEPIEEIAAEVEAADAGGGVVEDVVDVDADDDSGPGPGAVGPEPAAGRRRRHPAGEAVSVSSGRAARRVAEVDLLVLHQDHGAGDDARAGRRGSVGSAGSARRRRPRRRPQGHAAVRCATSSARRASGPASIERVAGSSVTALAPVSFHRCSCVARARSAAAPDHPS